MSKGLIETANILHREANLESSAIMRSATAYQPFTYRNPGNVTVSFETIEKIKIKYVFAILLVQNYIILLRD